MSGTLVLGFPRSAISGPYSNSIRGFLLQLFLYISGGLLESTIFLSSVDSAFPLSSLPRSLSSSHLQLLGPILDGCPARCQAGPRQEDRVGMGASSVTWKAGLVTSRTRGYQGSTWAQVPYRGGTSLNRGKWRTGPTRNSAQSASARTRERAAQDSADPPEAALLPPAHRGNSPKPFTYCSSTKHNQVGNSSLPRRAETFEGAMEIGIASSRLGWLPPVPRSGATRGRLGASFDHPLGSGPVRWHEAAIPSITRFFDFHSEGTSYYSIIDLWGK